MIFVDSSFWIGYERERDGRHADARTLADAYLGSTRVTSTAVVAETWTFLRRKAGHLASMAWLDTVTAGRGLRIERIDKPLEDAAWAWLRVHDERPYSFVDATSFALMRKLRITDVLAFDGDFAAAGFNELRA